MEKIEKDADPEGIYMNIDNIETKDNESGVYQNSVQKADSEAAPARGQVCSGCPAAVCLGLLCVLLLTVITGLSIKHNGERERLWSRYTELQSKYDSISGTIRNLTLEKNNLKTSYETLTLERDAYQRQLTEIDVACPVGWTRFMTSCYYISSISNTWDQSRQDCRRKRADLVIINSSEEQKFVSGFGKQLWIGLTDRDMEGSWKWVDGTSLVSGYGTIRVYSGWYWKHGAPNNDLILRRYQDRDCAQVAPSRDPLSNWNDLSCNSRLYWICEKKTRCTSD